MQQHIDEITEYLTESIIAWRSEIGSFVAEVVRNWDTRTLAACARSTTLLRTREPNQMS
jgi:hypothetical protein